MNTAAEKQRKTELRELVLSLHEHCRNYTTADNTRATFQLISTPALFVAVTALM